MLNALTSPAEISLHFRDTLTTQLQIAESKVPIAPMFKTPMRGELYWIYSRHLSAKVARHWKLRYHTGAGVDPNILYVSSPARRNVEVLLRVRCRRLVFCNLLSSRALRCLSPRVCDDQTHFGVEMNLSLEGAGWAAVACGKLLSDPNFLNERTFE